MPFGSSKQFGGDRFGALGRFGAGRFGEAVQLTPFDLFRQSELGDFFDNSRLDLMWQDAAGTTPAVADGPVGLQLGVNSRVSDVEKVANTGGPFIDASGWTAYQSATVSVVDGCLRIQNHPTTPGYGGATRGITTVIGRLYKCTITTKNGTAGAGTAYFSIGTSSGGGYDNGYYNMPYNSTKDYYFIATATTTYISICVRGNTANQYSDYYFFGCREISGIVRYQATAGNRLTLKYDSAAGRYYLSQEGVTTAHLVTTTLNATAYDCVTVWAGVRKLSDAARGTIVDNVGINGLFYLNAPSLNLSGFAFASRGTTTATASVTTPAAPVTVGITAYARIATKSCVLRIKGTNGTQETASTGDQGSGTYANYPLCWFTRADISHPFTGREYCSGFRFSLTPSTDREIRDMERWITARTPIS